MALDLSGRVSRAEAKIVKANIPTYWGYNMPKLGPLATCGECNGQIEFHPTQLIWIHLDPEISTGCPDLDLRKPGPKKVFPTVEYKSDKQIAQALMGVQEDEWKRHDWIKMETVGEIDWSWPRRFGRGLLYGWIQVLAELYLPWIGLACYKIHQLLRRKA